MAEKTIVLSLSEFNELLHSEDYLETIYTLEDDIAEDVHTSTDLYPHFKKSKVEKGMLLTLLCVARPLHELGLDLTEDLMFRPDEIDDFSDFFDKVIKLAREKKWEEETTQVVAAKH